MKGRKLCACGCKEKLPALSLKEKDPFATTECVRKFFSVRMPGDVERVNHKPTPTKAVKAKLGRAAA